MTYVSSGVSIYRELINPDTIRLRACEQTHAGPLPGTFYPLLPALKPSFLTAKHPRLACRPQFVPTREMADRSGSARFRAHFESALLAYRKITGVTSAEHPTAVRLQNCDSVESITTLLLYEARAFSDFRGFDRITRAIHIRKKHPR